MKKVLFAALMCGFMAMPAYAAETEKGERMSGDSATSSFAEHIMQKMDKDNDGVVSMDEHEAFNAKMFSTVDENNDRQLSRQEIAAYKEQKKGDWKGGEKKSY